MFKHWMSKAQNNTSHFDKGAAHCTVMFISSSLTQKKTISVCSILSHDKIEHTMINICCLLPFCFWNVEWMQIFRSSLGCTLNLVYFFCITCIDDKRWSAACIVSNSDEIFWTDYEHALVVISYLLSRTHKGNIFWEGHKILQNPHLTFVYSTYRQK